MDLGTLSQELLWGMKVTRSHIERMSPTENDQFCSHHDGRVPKWSCFVIRMPRRTTPGKRAWGKSGQERAIRVEKIIESIGGRLGLISKRAAQEHMAPAKTIRAWESAVEGSLFPH